MLQRILARRDRDDRFRACGDNAAVLVSVEHVDGGFNAKARDQLLSWLKADTGREDQCRILTNARCLSEGVDVPALDAVLFLHPRKSQIDVVQAVDRVMRRAPDKELGYVILPVGIPAGVAPEDALNNNEKYRVVWQIQTHCAATTSGSTRRSTRSSSASIRVTASRLWQTNSQPGKTLVAASVLAVKAGRVTRTPVMSGLHARRNRRFHHPLGR